MIQSKQPVTQGTAKGASATFPDRRCRWMLAKVLTNPGLLVWNVFLFVASPLLLGLKLRRYQRKRNNHELNLERWTLAHDREFLPPREPGKTRIAFVVASFGEILLVDPLTRQLRAEHSGVEVVWVVRDAHTLKELRQNRPEQPTVIWPFDAMWPVAKWLKMVDPDCVVFAERYSFPNLVVGSRLWGAKVLLINGRVKPVKRVFRRAAGVYYRWLFRNFDRLCFQSDQYEKRAQAYVSPEKTVAVGNLKLDLPRRTLDSVRAAELDAWLASAKDVPIVVAGSTNNLPEERFVLEAFMQVRAHTPCRLLLAPRKLDRVPEVTRLITELGLTYSLRSKKSAPADVMLLDTMGELAFAYGYGTAAYVGGSLNGMGHNLVEPLEFGIPVSYGPQRGHFEELQRLCEVNGVGFRLHDSSQLAAHWQRALTDRDFRASVSLRTHDLLTAQQGSMQSTYALVIEALKKES